MRHDTSTPSRSRGRRAVQAATGVLAALTVLGAQAAPALALGRPPATSERHPDTGDRRTGAGHDAARTARGRLSAEPQPRNRTADPARHTTTAAPPSARVPRAKHRARHAKAATTRKTHERNGVTPSDVGALVDGDAATVQISWTLPDSNLTEFGFRLHGATDLPCPATYTASGTCEVTDVPAGTYTVEYQHGSWAWDDAGMSADVPVAPPAAVTLTPTVHGLTVDWEASPTPGVTGYVAIASPVTAAARVPAHYCESSATGCDITGLAFQRYDVSVYARVGGADSEPATAQDTPLPEKPAAPTGVTARVSGPNAITISWHAVTSDHGVPITYMGAVSATNWGTGCWDEPMDALTCTVDGLPAGAAYTITAYAVGDVMSDPGRAAASLRIPLPSTVPANAPTMTSNLRGADPVAGGRITLTGRGFQPFSTVVLAVYSTPRILGTATAGENGTFTKEITLPDGLDGSHTLVASGLDRNGDQRYMKLAVDIAAGSGGGLPITGSPVLLLVIVGSALVTAGGGLLAGVRPRTPARPR